MNYLVIDTETGGTNPNRHSLLEVGLAAYVGGEIIARKQFYIKEEEYIVTPKAMEINGLDLVDVHDQGVNINQAVAFIRGFITLNFPKGMDYQILGHNPSFDRNFIKRLFERCNHDIDEYMSYRLVDTSTMIAVAKALGKLPMVLSGSLHKVAEYLGIDIGRAHTAMGDIKTTVAVYEALLELIGGVAHSQTV